MENFGREDDSEDGDDEDSQADDRVLCVPDVVNCDSSSSISSTEDNSHMNDLTVLKVAFINMNRKTKHY